MAKKEGRHPGSEQKYKLFNYSFSSTRLIFANNINDDYSGYLIRLEPVRYDE
jgi:hypothetical protein